MRGRYLAVAVLAAAACGIGGLGESAAAQDKVKVPQDSKLRGLMDKLYGETDNTDRAGREDIFLEIDKILAKDKKGVAIKTPAFWESAIHQGRFAGKKKKRYSTKKVLVETVPVEFEGKSGEVAIAVHAGAKYNKKNTSPLLLTVLNKGEDPKAFLTTLSESDESFKKANWIIAAVAETDKYPISQHTYLLADPLIQLRNMFNVDSDRWFVQGIGDSCETVQKAASETFFSRLAGLVLRNPAIAIRTENSSMYTACILHDEAGGAVAHTYTADDERNKAIPAGEGADAAVLYWLQNHKGRALPNSYTFETTISPENRGEVWSGTLQVLSPGKRGEKTTVTVTYDRDKNVLDVAAENLSEFIVFMNDDLLDLDKPVRVVANGEELANRQFQRDLRQMFELADSFGEYGRVFPVSFRGVVKSEIAPPDEEEKKEGDEGGEEGGGEGGDKDGGDDKKSD